MIRTCATCDHVYNDEYNWTLCPHVPLGAGPAPFHPTSNPGGYCKEHDFFACKMETHRSTDPGHPQFMASHLDRAFTKEEKMPTDKQAPIEGTRDVEHASPPPGVVSGSFYRPKTAGIAPAQEGPLQVLQFADFAAEGWDSFAVARAASQVANADGRVTLPRELRQNVVREALGHFLEVIVRAAPPGPERSTSISRAREAAVWATLGISLER